MQGSWTTWQTLVLVKRIFFKTHSTLSCPTGGDRGQNLNITVGVWVNNDAWEEFLLFLQGPRWFNIYSLWKYSLIFIVAVTEILGKNMLCSKKMLSFVWNCPVTMFNMINRAHIMWKSARQGALLRAHAIVAWQLGYTRMNYKTVVYNLKRHQFSYNM